MNFPTLRAGDDRTNRTHARRAPLRAVALGLALLAFQTTLPGCFGRFALTRKLYALNQSVNDKWLRSILTFVMVAVPVYGVCAFADWALFNTIEFWGGHNPVDGQSSDVPPPQAPAALITTSNDGSAVQLKLSPDGSELRVELANPGILPRVLVLKMSDAGAALHDGEGRLISTLALDDSGNAQVRGADGKILEEKSALARMQLEEAVRSGGRALLAELELQSGKKIAAAR